MGKGGWVRGDEAEGGGGGKWMGKRMGEWGKEGAVCRRKFGPHKLTFFFRPDESSRLMRHHDRKV
jgi:hypothetical protein